MTTTETRPGDPAGTAGARVTRSGTFTGTGAHHWVRSLLDQEGAALDAWAGDPAGAPRLALRATSPEPVGTLRVPGGDGVVDADDVVAVVTREGGRAELLAAYPETTPSWALGRDRLVRLLSGGLAGEETPWPALQQLALCWLGQAWQRDGATTLEDALRAWVAADRSDLPPRVAHEAAQLRAGASGDEPAVAGVLADLGVAVPYDDPVALLDAVLAVTADSALAA